MNLLTFVHPFSILGRQRLGENEKNPGVGLRNWWALAASGLSLYAFKDVK